MITSAGLIFSPALASSDDQSPDLVVLTYNVLYNNTDFTAISEVIRASGADVVLLQEVTAALARDLPPLLRLDYLFHNDSFTAQSATVGTSSGGSDHYPLRVELTLS